MQEWAAGAARLAVQRTALAAEAHHD